MVRTRSGTWVAPFGVAQDAGAPHGLARPEPAAAGVAPAAAGKAERKRRSGRLAENALGDISNCGAGKRDAPKGGGDRGAVKAARRASTDRSSGSAGARASPTPATPASAAVAASAPAAVAASSAGPPFDVDQENMDDPQQMVPYMAEIQQCYVRTQTHRRPGSDYISRHQPNLSNRMRGILIDWLIEVHHKFKLHIETLYGSIDLIDRYLAACAPLPRSKLQLVGVTAMFIASKYEEIFAPECRDFVYISDNAYERDEVLRMEATMLSTLGFHLTSPSSYVFLLRLVAVARLSGSHAENLAAYLLELTLPEASFLDRRPALLSAAATYLALRGTGRPWDAEFGRAVGVEDAEVRACAAEINALQKRKDAVGTAYVRKKYAMEKYGAVSGIPPVDL